MARVLITNFHPIGGGGHVPYIQALTVIGRVSPHCIGVAAPEDSRIYRYLMEQRFPYLFPCDFPAKIQRELPSIIAAIRRFKAVVREFRPDIVHANGSPDLSIAAWSDPFAKHYRLIRTHHAIKGIPNTAYHRWLYDRRVLGNVFVSRSAREMSSELGLAPSNTVVIENGVDLSHFSPRPRDRDLAAHYGISDDTFCFGSCAGLGGYKRVDAIIEAARLISRNRKFKILALGDQAAGERLQQLAAKTGVSEFVYGGFHKDVRPLVSLFDVGFVLSDAIETVSFAAREMMAMGKPLLSSSFSGLKENVVDGENGLLIEPGRIDQIARAMEHYLQMDRAELARFGSAARRYAEEKFNIDKQVHDQIVLIESVLAARPSSQ